MTLGKQFRIEDWDATVDFFDRIFRLTTPYNLLNIMPIYNKLKEINTDKKTFSELKVQNFTIKIVLNRLMCYPRSCLIFPNKRSSRHPRPLFREID